MVLIDPVTAMSSTGKSSSPAATTSSTAMTPTKAKDGTSATGDATGPAASQPIRVLGAPHAQAARHVHTALLLSLFSLRFKALVADPVSTMCGSLPVLAALQATYAILCLPAAGSQSTKPARKPRPGEKKKPGSETSGPNIMVVRAILYPSFHACMAHS